MSHLPTVWLKENQVRLVGSSRSFTCIYNFQLSQRLLAPNNPSVANHEIQIGPHQNPHRHLQSSTPFAQPHQQPAADQPSCPGQNQPRCWPGTHPRRASVEEEMESWARNHKKTKVQTFLASGWPQTFLQAKVRVWQSRDRLGHLCRLPG